MRGFFTFLLALAGLFALLSAMQVYSENARASHEAESRLLFLDRAFYAQTDAEHAIIDSLKQEARKKAASPSPPSTCEMAEALGERLASLASDIESKDFHGFKALFWCGTPPGSELAALADEMAKEGKAKRCASCHSPDEDVLVYDPVSKKTSLVKACSLFLLPAPGFITVSSFGALKPSTAPPTSLRASIGVSLYDAKENASFISVLPQDFRVNYA